VFNVFPLKRLLQQISVSLLYVTIPNFEVPTQEIRALSGGQLIFFTPVVTDETIDAWESYLTQNQEWIHEGLHVMEDGHQVYDEQVRNHADPGKIPPFVHILQGDKVCKLVLHGVYAPLWPYSPPWNGLCHSLKKCSMDVILFYQNPSIYDSSLTTIIALVSGRR